MKKAKIGILLVLFTFFLLSRPTQTKPEISRRTVIPYITPLTWRNIMEAANATVSPTT